jgi:hypothetical protein
MDDELPRVVRREEAIQVAYRIAVEGVDVRFILADGLTLASLILRF